MEIRSYMWCDVVKKKKKKDSRNWQDIEETNKSGYLFAEVGKAEMGHMSDGGESKTLPCIFRIYLYINI